MHTRPTIATPPTPCRGKPLGRFDAAVQDLCHGLHSAGEVLVLSDPRGEVAALMPAAEYRRLQAIAGEGR